MSMPTALYRLFGEDDALLYVGISGAFGRRWHEHSKEKPWWTEARRATLEWHETREAAGDAEEAAIKAEHPKYNIMHNVRELPIQAPQVDRLGLTEAERGRLPVTLDIAEAAKVIGLDRRKARELARSERFPCRVFTIGQQYRVPTSVLLNTSGLTFNSRALRDLVIRKAA